MIRYSHSNNNGIFIYLELGLRWFIGIVFIYASVTKIGHPALFAKSVYSYGLFPNFLINLIAITVPYLELLSGLFLISGVYPKGAMLVLNTLLALFILLLSVNFIRGHQFDCGCFNPGENVDKPTLGLLLRDMVYLIFGSYVFLFKGKRILCLMP